MTTTAVTAAQVNEVMQRHNDFWSPEADIDNEAVRQYARYLRFAAREPGADYDDNMVQAAELDLLIDQIEANA